MPLLYCLQREFEAHYPEENFCNVRPKESLPPFVSVSYEGETFVTRDELKKVRTMRQFARKNRITVFFAHKNRNPNVKKGKTENLSGYQNRKTGDFECKNRKTDLKSDQNRKTEKPNVPLAKCLSRDFISVVLQMNRCDLYFSTAGLHL